ncbi:hypothetical protein PENSPDRAFT_100938 [Peniophora sp. CONT]|nr:hypothetical protein PENSPDRAFT_100938 [Peniophora sp. CONT]
MRRASELCHAIRSKSARLAYATLFFTRYGGLIILLFVSSPITCRRQPFITSIIVFHRYRREQQP